jgi:hypothetical protein
MQSTLPSHKRQSGTESLFLETWHGPGIHRWKVQGFIITRVRSYTPQFTLSIMSHNCLQCIGPFLCHPLPTKTRVSFLIGNWRTPALMTLINPGHLTLRTHTRARTSYGLKSDHWTATVPQQLRARSRTLSVGRCVSQNFLVQPVASLLLTLSP